MTIFSIGHSTRALDEFLALLAENGVTRLADIRRYPGSQRYPHFSKQALQQLTAVKYEHFEDLGGRRKPSKDSVNTALKNDQFRAYADHMATPEFQQAVDRLLAGNEITAYMCAEAVPWRCHRNLLSDELVRRGVEVLHILGKGSAKPHELSPLARIEGERIVYAVARNPSLFDTL